MALPNLLFFVVYSFLAFQNVGYVQTKALNEFINYYEPVFFEGNPKLDFGYHDFKLAEGADAPSIAKDVQFNSVNPEIVDIRAFGRAFKLELNRSVVILSTEADVTIMSGKDSCTTEKLDPTTIIPNLVQGRVVDEPKSYVHGVLIKGVFTGVIHLANQTLFIERASKYFRDRMPFESVIFRQEDLNMTAVDCEAGPDGYKCDPIRLLHRKGPGVEQVLSLARSERSWFRHKERPKTTCTLKVIADHMFTKHAGDGSPINAIYEMIFHVQEADHIYRNTDFDQDGENDNVGFKIHEVMVLSSPICLENRAFMKPKLTSDQYLEIFSEYDFENYCVGIAFSGFTFPGRILGIAWMADADESGYVGGICEPRLFSTQDQKALSFNSAVITMMLQGRRMPRGITAIAVAHELGHSFGSDHDPHPDEVCSPSDKDGGRYIMASVAVKGDQPNNRIFSPCSVDNMKTVLRKKGNCFISISKSVFCDGLNETCSLEMIRDDDEPENEEDKSGKDEFGENFVNLKGGPTKTEPKEGKKGNKKNPQILQELKAAAKGGNGEKPVKPGKKGKPKEKPEEKKKPPRQAMQSQNDTGEEEENKKDSMKPINCSAQSNAQGRRVPECLGPDKTSIDEERISCSTAQCKLYGKVDCECTDLKSSCVVCCKQSEDSSDCTPIRRKDTPWWLLRRPGEPCRGDRGKCDAHGRCNMDKTDPTEADKMSRTVETTVEIPFDASTPAESCEKFDSMAQFSHFISSVGSTIEWFFETLFRVLWMCVSFLFFLFIILFICFVCPAVAVGIWCLQQCTCWSASSTLHDDDMYVMVDESDENFFKHAPQSVVVTSSQTFPDIEIRNRNQ